MIARTALRALFVGACLAALMGVGRLLGWWSQSVVLGLAVLIGLPLGVAALAAIRCVWKADWLPVARAVDWHYELKDRTESALTFAEHSAAGGTPWEELQLADALRHLRQVEAQVVVPRVLPKSWRWAAATTLLAIGLLCWPTIHASVTAGPADPIEAIVAEAEQVEADLQVLLDQLPEVHDPEVDKVIKELLAKADEMKQPDVDLREAFAKLSEMQSELQALAAELNVGAVDQQMKSIGEALQSAESLKSAGEALQKGEFNKAADELAKLDNPPLDRKETRAVTDKLNKSAEQAAQKGQKKLGEAAKQLAEGLDKGDTQQTKEGLSKLSESAKQQANRKQVSDLLKKQCDKLGESKGNCQANSNKGARPSREAGKGSNAETQGQRTDLASKHNEERIEGQKGQQGETDVEKESTTTEADEKAQRATKEVYQKYRKLSDAVLEGEDIPLGHRQTIRRYFEAIRPKEQP